MYSKNENHLIPFCTLDFLLSNLLLYIFRLNYYKFFYFYAYSLAKPYMFSGWKFYWYIFVRRELFCMTKSLLSRKDLFLPFSVRPRLFIVPLLLFFIYVYFCNSESGIPDIGLCKAGLLLVRVLLLASFFTFVTLITGYMNDEVRLDFDNCG